MEAPSIVSLSSIKNRSGALRAQTFDLNAGNIFRRMRDVVQAQMDLDYFVLSYFQATSACGNWDSSRICFL